MINLHVQRSVCLYDADGVSAALDCVAAAVPDATEPAASRLKTVLLLTDGYVSRFVLAQKWDVESMCAVQSFRGRRMSEQHPPETKRTHAMPCCCCLVHDDREPSDGNDQAACLQAYLQRQPELVCSVNTFGFGYSLKSDILEDLARVGRGMYACV